MQPVEDKQVFPRSEHLKSSLAIKEVMDANQSVYSYPIKCYYDLPEQSGRVSVQLAVTVPKKRFHHAVDRNLLKRLMREGYRLEKHQLLVPEGKCCRLCWIFVAKEMASFAEVREAASSVFQKINLALETQRNEKTV